MRIDLVVRECGGIVVTCIKIFDGFVMLVEFLVWDAKDGGWFWLESQLLHLREAIDAV